MHHIQSATKDSATKDSATRDSALAILDLAHLAQQTGGDRPLQRELLEIFRARSAALVETMCEMARAEPPRGRELGDLAHQLKGSALTLGAFAVAAKAEAVEQALTGPLQELRGSDPASAQASAQVSAQASAQASAQVSTQAALRALAAALNDAFAAIEAHMAHPA